MRLAELSPRWVGAGGEGITRDGQPVPERHGVGVSFECPCGGDCLRCFVAFANPIDGGPPYTSQGQPTWQRTGEDFETLTLSPSILRRDNCGWHGFIRDGAIITV